MVYAGSKNRIAKEILEAIDKHLGGKKYENFVDLFCGGCNLIDKVSPSVKRFANDSNKFLIAFWKGVMKQGGLDENLIITKEEYINSRDKWRSGAYTDDDLFEMGRNGILASVKGKYFNGYSGHAVASKIVGGGRSRNYIQEHIRNVNKQIPNLQGVMFTSLDYREVELPQPNGTLIYCDIPYRDTTKYIMSNGFDYDGFYDWCVDRTKQGYSVFVSEYSMPDDRFECIWSKPVTNTLAIKSTKRVTEKLFTPKLK